MTKKAQVERELTEEEIQAMNLDFEAEIKHLLEEEENDKK